VRFLPDTAVSKAAKAAVGAVTENIQQQNIFFTIIIIIIIKKFWIYIHTHMCIYNSNSGNNSNSNKQDKRGEKIVLLVMSPSHL